VLVDGDLQRVTTTERDGWYDWTYTRDDQPVTARVDFVGPPAAGSGDSSSPPPPPLPDRAPQPAPVPPSQQPADRRAPATRVPLRRRQAPRSASAPLRLSVRLDEQAALAADLRQGRRIAARFSRARTRPGRPTAVTLRLDPRPPGADPPRPADPAPDRPRRRRRGQRDRRAPDAHRVAAPAPVMA
jgi:hypothetical protein